MGVQKFLCINFVLLMLLISSSQGYKFDVGGKDGWVLNPSETYNHWAERNRFQVNDTLFFKFKTGNESVLLVTRENYNHCNVKNPIKSLAEGESELKFERSGPHCFISGNEDHCKKGQKLVIVVLAVRPKKPTSTPTILPPSASLTPSSPAPALSGPAPGSSVSDEPSSSPNTSFALRMSWSLSLAVGVGVFMGCFGWKV